MKCQNIFSKEQKLIFFGEGEWVDEPDIVEFEYKDYTCKLFRIMASESDMSMFGGHFCGYVYLTEDDIFYRTTDKDIDIHCHGGLTYIKKRDNFFILGFDCAHMTDLVPSFKKLCFKYSLELPYFDKSYKNIAFCISECKSIVDQVIEANSKKLEPERC